MLVSSQMSPMPLSSGSATATTALISVASTVAGVVITVAVVNARRRGKGDWGQDWNNSERARALLDSGIIDTRSNLGVEVGLVMSDPDSFERMSGDVASGNGTPLSAIAEAANLSPSVVGRHWRDTRAAFGDGSTEQDAFRFSLLFMARLARDLTVDPDLAASLLWDPDELGDLHVLISTDPRRSTVQVGLTGLVERAQDWLAVHPGLDRSITAEGLAAALAHRQIAHVLGHQLDETEHRSRRRDWRYLSDWSRGKRAGELDPLAYATVQGASHRREDWATSVERYSVPDLLPSDRFIEPQCMIPGKWRLLDAHFGVTPGDTPCADLALVGLDPDEVESIDVVFMAASTASAASIAGHTAIAVTFRPTESGMTRQRAYALQAHTGGLTGLKYIARGITGGWAGQVDESSYRGLAIRYSESDDRDLKRYRLLLDDDQKRAVLERLDELQQAYRRPYLFFTRNCQELPRELAEVALGERLKLPATYPPNTLLAAMDDAGLIERVQPEYVIEHALSSRTRAARRLTNDVLEDGWAHSHPLRRDLRSRDPERRARGYAALSDGLATGELPQQTWGALDDVYAWASSIERQLPNDQATRDALRGARAALRRTAAEAGVDLDSGPSSEEQLLLALSPRSHQGSTHTSLRRFGVHGMARDEGDGLTPWVVLTSQLYGNRMGSARRYELVSGLEVKALTGEVQVSVSVPISVRTRWQFFSLTRVRGQSTVLNPGLYIQVVDGLIQRRSHTGVDITWAGAGGVLELLQLAKHRHHLHLRVGATARTTRTHESAGLTGVIGLGVPIQARLALGSGRQALTELRLEGTYQPVFAVGGLWQERSVRALLRVRAVELFGVDVALTGDARAVLGNPLWPEGQREVRMGVELEPF